MSKLAKLQADLKAVEDAIKEIAPNGNYCKKCGATDVYWMTCMPRREAEFISKSTGNHLALKLGRGRLFNIDGGEHFCAPTDDGFTNEETEA